MDYTTELEFKFVEENPGQTLRAPDAIVEVQSICHSLGIPAEKPLTFEVVDVYYDDADDTLLKSGCCLRRRESDGTQKLTLKCKKDESLKNGLLRLEDEFAISDQGIADLLSSPDRIAAEFAERFHITLRTGTVASQLVVRNKRTLLLFSTHSGRYEFFYDRCVFAPDLDGAASGKVSEIEIELKNGTVQGDTILRDFMQQITERLGFRPSTLSKFERGMQLIRGGSAVVGGV